MSGATIAVKEIQNMKTNYVPPISCGQSQKQISELAKEVATKFNFGPGDDLIAFVENFGGRVIYQELRELNKSDSGSILVEPDGKFEITLPNHTSSQRDRFTIAHEIGHWALHFLSKKDQNEHEGLAAARYGSGPVEYEANWFAASLLMPDDKFSQCYTNQAGDLRAVANYFAVSLTAAAVRAKALGLDGA